MDIDVVNAISKTIVYIPERDLKGLELSSKVYLMGIRETAKKFLTYYINCYTKGDKNNANQVYESGWKRFIDEEISKNPYTETILKRIRDCVNACISGMARKDKELAV